MLRSFLERRGMRLSIRNADLHDVQNIIDSKWPGIALSELLKFRDAYFDTNGKYRRFLTGYPDTVWVAKLGNRALGYLHFYTDCWDGNKDTLIALVIDPSLSTDDQRKIKEKLKKEFDLNEP